MLRTTIIIAALLSANTAYAKDYYFAPSEETKTRGFIGLNWTFGANSGPEAVVGVARVKTKTDGDAHGAKASLHFGLSNGISFSKAKVVAVSGKYDRMGEFGFGYSAATRSALVTIGAWAPYINLGGDFDFNGNFSGYIGANSLKKWKKPGPVLTLD